VHLVIILALKKWDQHYANKLRKKFVGFAQLYKIAIQRFIRAKFTKKGKKSLAYIAKRNSRIETTRK
jgi:hypothetical protein